jgi:hypothetical protein
MLPTSPRLLLSITLGLVGLLAQPAIAADWTAAPAANQFGSGRQEYGYTLNPGGRLQDGIVVANAGTGRLEVTLRAAGDATRKGLASWVHPARDTVTVRPGAPVTVPFIVTLPADAAPGDYAAGIVASSAGRRVAIPIRLRVGGALKPSLAVEHVGVDYADGDATVTYTIRNTGNAILTARPAVSVEGPFGRWAARAGKLADSPSLLPGATWRASARVRDVTRAVRLTATVTVVPLLSDAAGSVSPLAAVEASGHGWVVPWLAVLAIVLVCGLVVLGFRVRAAQPAAQGPTPPTRSTV